MLIVAAVLLVVVSVPLTGGLLGRLLELSIEATWAVFASLAVQILIVTVLPGGDAGLHRVLHFGSYALAGWFVWRNRRLPGVLVIAFGGALNLAAIAANGGVMPASRRAVEWSGLHLSAADFSNSAPLAHPHLLALGDVFALPAPLPLHNVFSVGDLIAVAGVTWLLHAVSGSRLAARVGRRTRIGALSISEATAAHVLFRVSGRGVAPVVLTVSTTERVETFSPLPLPGRAGGAWTAGFAVPAGLADCGAAFSVRAADREIPLPRVRRAAGLPDRPALAARLSRLSWALERF